MICVDVPYIVFQQQAGQCCCGGLNMHTVSLSLWHACCASMRTAPASHFSSCLQDVGLYKQVKLFSDSQIGIPSQVGAACGMPTLPLATWHLSSAIC